MTGWTAVIVALIAAVPATIAAVASLIASRRAKENRVIARRIEHQTNGQMDEKIRKAVVAVFNEHKTDVTEAVMAESVRHLLNALINEPER